MFKLQMLGQYAASLRSLHGNESLMFWFWGGFVLFVGFFVIF